MPFVIVIIFVLFLELKKFWDKKENQSSKKKKLMILFITVYACMSNILYSLVNLMNCRELSPGNSFLNAYLDESCLSYRYIMWFSAFILPFFCFFAIFLPLLALFFMFCKKQMIFNKDNFILSFLTLGFKKNKYYW